MQPAKAVPHSPLMTVAEYLAFEQASDTKHTFLDGVVTAMAGENPLHGDVSVNVVGALLAQLAGKPCRLKIKDTRVRSGPRGPRPRRPTAGMFSYPDIVVVCGRQEVDEDGMTILNPTVIVEVLSPSTALFDRGDKAVRYREWNTTLTDYVVVWADEPRVECSTRQAAGRWLLTEYRGLDAVVPLASIGCTLPLAVIYADISLPDPEPE